LFGGVFHRPAGRTAARVAEVCGVQKLRFGLRKYGFPVALIFRYTPHVFELAGQIISTKMGGAFAWSIPANIPI